MARMPRVIGGRYGLSSKEFTPAMAAAVFDELAEPKPKRHFTVGIVDDVTHLSLKYDPTFSTERDDVVRAVFFGLGSDGTVGANKNSVKIIGESTPLYAQGYFVYDSKKSGSTTVSHLRFSPRPINSSYLIERANFVACHQFGFLERNDVLEVAEPGATFLLNSPYGPDEVWDRLPAEVAASRSSTRSCGSTSSTPSGWPTRRSWAAGSTRSCRPASSPWRASCPREEAIAKIKEAIEQDVRQARRDACCGGTSPPSTAPSTPSTRWRSPPRSAGNAGLAAADLRRRARLRQAGHAR